MEFPGSKEVYWIGLLSTAMILMVKSKLHSMSLRNCVKLILPHALCVLLNEIIEELESSLRIIRYKGYIVNLIQQDEFR